MSDCKTLSQQTIYLAGGCFWGMQAYFSGVEGVFETEVGYANAQSPNPKYEDVESDYAETIRIEYDKDLLSLEFLLQLFFEVIDPTLLNRQGNDVGRQYRTGIYYQDEVTQEIVNKALEQLASKYTKPIVVESMFLENFTPAEASHQNYLEKNPFGYCHISKSQIIKAHQSSYQKSKDLKERLSPIQYYVTQENGTEPPFANEYWDCFQEGIYVDIIDGTPLFVSIDKFDSSCGWPAFARPIEEGDLLFFQDNQLELERTEVRAKKSNAHLGHLFYDAPIELGGERYCINSASLRFIPKEKMKEKGYAEYISMIE